MHHWHMYEMARIRHADRLAQGERARLLRTQRRPRTEITRRMMASWLGRTLWARLLSAVGRGLVALGKRLQDQAATVG